MTSHESTLLNLLKLIAIMNDGLYSCPNPVFDLSIRFFYYSESIILCLVYLPMYSFESFPLVMTRCRTIWPRNKNYYEIRTQNSQVSAPKSSQ